MNKLLSVFAPSEHGRFQVIVQARFILFFAGAGNAQIFDPPPVPYCNVSYAHPFSYTELENHVLVANPQGKASAQFVL